MAPQPDQRIRPQMLPQHYQPLIVPMQTLFPRAKHAARRHGANVRQSSQQRYPGWSRELSWSKYTGENGTKTRTQRRWEGHCWALQQTKNNREWSYGTISGAFRKLLEIFQNVSRNFSKNLRKSCSKNHQNLLFVTKVAKKLLEKKLFLLWYATCTSPIMQLFTSKPFTNYVV